MQSIRFRAILIALLALPPAAQAQTFPGADWQRKTPAEAGIVLIVMPFAFVHSDTTRQQLAHPHELAAQ